MLFSRWMWRCRSLSISASSKYNALNVLQASSGARVIVRQPAHFDQRFARRIVLHEHHTNRVLHAAAMEGPGLGTAIQCPDQREQHHLFLGEVPIQFRLHGAVDRGHRSQHLAMPVAVGLQHLGEQRLHARKLHLHVGVMRVQDVVDQGGQGSRQPVRPILSGSLDSLVDFGEQDATASRPFREQASATGILPPQQKSMPCFSKTRTAAGDSAAIWPTVRSVVDVVMLRS